MAEKAGVSQATVSMILNRRNNVSFSEETVERVEAAARELPGAQPEHKEPEHIPMNSWKKLQAHVWNEASERPLQTSFEVRE